MWFGVLFCFVSFQLLVLSSTICEEVHFDCVKKKLLFLHDVLSLSLSNAAAVWNKDMQADKKWSAKGGGGKDKTDDEDVAFKRMVAKVSAPGACWKKTLAGKTVSSGSHR